jgi:hypothetical protein
LVPHTRADYLGGVIIKNGAAEEYIFAAYWDDEQLVGTTPTEAELPPQHLEFLWVMLKSSAVPGGTRH